MTQLIVFCAEYLFILPLAIAAAVFIKQPRNARRTMLIRAVVVVALEFVLAKIGAAAYFDPRPFTLTHIAPLVPHGPDNGFPSDHSLVVFGCAFLLIPFSTSAAIVSTVVAVAVGAGRIASHLHTPLDVCASAAFAAVANFTAWRFVKPAPNDSSTSVE